MKRLLVAALLAFFAVQIGFAEQSPIQTEISTFVFVNFQVEDSTSAVINLTLPEASSPNSVSQVSDDVKKAIDKHIDVLTLFKFSYVEEIDAVEFTEKLYKGGIAAASDPNSR